MRMGRSQRLDIILGMMVALENLLQENTDQFDHLKYMGGCLPHLSEGEQRAFAEGVQRLNEERDFILKAIAELQGREASSRGIFWHMIHAVDRMNKDDWQRLHKERR